MKKNNKGPARLIGRSTMGGFTLIELLVVIGIIAILLAIVLTVLNDTKGKSNDAKIKAQLSGMKTQAQLYYTSSYQTDSGHMGTIPISGSNMFADTAATSIASLVNLVNGLPKGTRVYYNAPTNALPSNGGKWVFAADVSDGMLCVDYTGALKYFKGTQAGSYANITTAFSNFNSSLCN